MAVPEPESGIARLDFQPVPQPGGDDKEAIVVWQQQISQYLQQEQQVLQALLGGSLRWQNLRSNLISNGDAGQPAHTGSADSIVTFVHDLGKVPEFYLWNLTAAGPFSTVEHPMLYHTSANKTAWTTSNLLVRCNVANSTFTVLVM